MIKKILMSMIVATLFSYSAVAEIVPVPIIVFKYTCLEKVDADSWLEYLNDGNYSAVTGLFGSPTSSCYTVGVGNQVGIPTGMLLTTDGQEVLIIGQQDVDQEIIPKTRFRIQKVDWLEFPIIVTTDRLVTHKRASKEEVDWANRTTSYTIIPQFHNDQIYPEGDCFRRMDCPLPTEASPSQQAELR